MEPDTGLNNSISQDYITTGLQDYRTTELQDYRNLGLQEYNRNKGLLNQELFFLMKKFSIYFLHKINEKFR